MTSERDFDRLAQAWLELGPDEAPDRVIAAVLQAAHRTPQVRRPMRWPSWRSFDMTRLPLVAGAAAVLVVVIVGGGLFLARNSSTGDVTPITSPTPSAATLVVVSASPSSGASEAPVDDPAKLTATWVGPKRTIADMIPSGRYRFILAATDLRFVDDLYRTPQLASVVAAAGPNELRLTTTDSTVGCTTGDVGRYGWSLSPADSKLRLAATSDACQGRADALAGDWYRVACKNYDSGCFGDLGDAGTYPSQYIAPRRRPNDSWAPNFGAVTYTVPAGWANSADWPNTLTLTPMSSYVLETKDGPPKGRKHEVDVLTQPHGNRQTRGCGRAIDPKAPTTVDGLLGWLAKQPSLTTTAPTAITVDGHPGKWVDLSIATSWTQTCTGGPSEPASTFLAYPVEGPDGWTLTMAGKERIRLMLVDLDGQTIAILTDSADPNTFNDLVAEATPIIASIRFK